MGKTRTSILTTIIVLMCLVPPFHGAYHNDLGYWPLFVPPRHYAVVDFLRLGIQCFVAALLLGAFPFQRSNRPERPESTVIRNLAWALFGVSALAAFAMYGWHYEATRPPEVVVRREAAAELPIPLSASPSIPMKESPKKPSPKHPTKTGKPQPLDEMRGAAKVPQRQESVAQPQFSDEEMWKAAKTYGLVKQSSTPKPMPLTPPPPGFPTGLTPAPWLAVPPQQVPPPAQQVPPPARQVPPPAQRAKSFDEIWDAAAPKLPPGALYYDPTVIRKR